MVSAKYTEETPLKEVDFTSAAGAGAEAWAAAFNKGESIAAQKAQQDADVKAAQAGTDAVAEHGLGAPYPDSSSEAALHYRAAADKAMSSLINTQVASHVMNLYTEEAQKGWSESSAGDYSTKLKAYYNSTISDMPSNQRAIFMQASNTLGSHYGLQIAKNVGNQLQQDNKYNSAQTLNNLQQSLLPLMMDGGQLGPNAPQITAATSSILSSIESYPGTSTQKIAQAKQIGKSILQADIFGRLKTLQEARTRALGLSDPEKKKEQLDVVNSQIATIEKNPQGWIEKVRSSSNLYKFADPQSGLTAYHQFATNLKQGLAAQSQGATDNLNSIDARVAQGFPLTNQDNDQAMQSLPYSKNGEQIYNNIRIKADAIQHAKALMNTAGGVESVMEQSKAQTFIPGSKIANDAVHKYALGVSTKMKTDPAVASRGWYDTNNLYDTNNFIQDLNTKSFAKYKTSPQDVSQIVATVNSPNYYSQIAQGKSLSPAQQRIANTYTESLVGIQKNWGVTDALTSVIANDQYKDLNSNLANLSQSEQKVALRRLYENSPSEFGDIKAHLKNKGLIAQAWVAQAQESAELQPLADLVNNPGDIKKAQDLPGKTQAAQVHWALNPYHNMISNTYPKLQADALNDLMDAAAYTLYNDSKGSFWGVSGTGWIHGITHGSNAKTFADHFFHSLGLASIPNQTALTPLMITSPNNKNIRMVADVQLLGNNLDALKKEIYTSGSYYTPPKFRQLDVYQELAERKEAPMSKRIVSGLNPVASVFTQSPVVTYGHAVEVATWKNLGGGKVALTDLYNDLVWAHDPKTGEATHPYVYSLGEVQLMGQPNAK